ncbi:vWA domain-containing protein [Virgibacillus flavescens]|uniref:vWA domain-containing protein n=1 Tax=Virgibacillus flavescens TaxID=1611422 RepID=UPI003D325160
MNNQLTEIIFLLDRSGSMSGLEADTIGGFNALVDKQCKLEGETVLTAALFDDQYETIWSGIDANKVKLTEENYFVRGSTALLDAIGKTILDVGQRLSETSEERKPGKVLFVITTDGMENASREFSHKKVKEMIQHQKDKYDWEFIFIGANIDAAEEADQVGISSNDAYSFEASSKGVEKMYSMVSEELSYRRTK